MAGVTPLSSAVILAVGSELLTPSRVDTNSLYITEQLNLLGIDVGSSWSWATTARSWCTRAGR